MTTLDQKATQAEAISKRIQPMLQGRDPDVQGAVLADLVSLYFAGHHPAARGTMIDMWIKTMRDLIPVSEEQIFENRPRPDGWYTQ